MVMVAGNAAQTVRNLGKGWRLAGRIQQVAWHEGPAGSL